MEYQKIEVKQGAGGRTRLPRFKVLAKCPIGLHVILTWALPTSSGKDTPTRGYYNKLNLENSLTINKKEEKSITVYEGGTNKKSETKQAKYQVKA